MAPEPTTVTTPAGIEVRYTSAPKRMYEVRPTTRWTVGDWREVPSVTTVLGCLDKPALPWWGQRIGVEGVMELVRRDVLYAHYGDAEPYLGVRRGWYPEPATSDEVVALLTEHQLSTNHVRDKAGARGVAVHDAFETWATTGTRPDPSIFPEEERGYVVGLLAFLDDVNPEPLAAEVMVGSVQHGFAGRYDIRLRVPEECQVVFHRTPKKGPQYATLKPGVYLGDLKTSKGVYQESHGRQLEAYEAASVECGYEPTEARGILHVGADGTYEFVRSKCIFDDFLHVLAVWRDNQRIKEGK